MYLEGPKEDEWKRRNIMSIKEEEDKEKLEEKLNKYGETCDECGDKYFIEELSPTDSLDGEILFLCKYCI